MKKVKNYFLLILVLLSQLVSVSTALAVTAENETQDIFFEKDGNKVNGLEVSNETIENLTLVDSNMTDKALKIYVPDGLKLDLQKTREINLNNEEQIQYDEVSNQITLTFNQNRTAESRTNLIFHIVGQSSIQGKLYAETTRGDKSYTSNIVDVTTKRNPSEESSVKQLADQEILEATSSTNSKGNYQDSPPSTENKIENKDEPVHKNSNDIGSSKYTVKISAPDEIVVGNDITYTLTLNSNAIMDTPLKDVTLTAKLPEGFVYESIAENPYVKNVSNDPKTNSVMFQLNDVTDSIISFTFNAQTNNDQNKYNGLSVNTRVSGNDVGSGVPEDSQASTTITGSVNYTTSKSFTTIPATGNRAVTYYFNINSGSNKGQFSTWKQQITDYLPAGVEIIGNDNKTGSWNITGDKSSGWTAIWTREKVFNPGYDLGNEKDFPSLTVYYPEDTFLNGQRPPQNTSNLIVFDKNNQQYDGGSAKTQGPTMSSGSKEGLGVDKRSGTNQSNGFWYDGLYNRHLQIDGSFISSTGKSGREMTIEDDADKFNNDEFWKRLDVYQVDLIFNSQLAAINADYRLEYKTNKKDWSTAYSGKTKAGSAITFQVDGSVGFGAGNKRINLGNGEMLRGLRLVVGNKRDASVKIPSGSVATMDMYLFPSAENNETHTGSDDTKQWKSKATINGFYDADTIIPEASDNYNVAVKRNMMLGTNVIAPTTMNAGQDAEYTAYINNQSSSFDYEQAKMFVVLPAGVYFDQTKGVSAESEFSEDPYKLPIPKPGSGVTVSTQTQPPTDEYPYERQVVVFQFHDKIPAMRRAGTATDRNIERKGLGYKIPVKVTNDAYTNNPKGATITSWSTTDDSEFSGVDFYNYGNLLHTDDYNFDEGRDTIAWAQGNSQVQTKGGLLLTKLVSSSDSNYVTDSSAYSKDKMTWQIKLQNILPNQVGNTVIFDKLPQKDQKNDFSTELSGPISGLPDDATIEYSKDATNESSGQWSSDWHGATSFKVTLSRINSGQSILMDIPFDIPSKVKTDNVIKNSASGKGDYNGSEVSFGSNEASVKIKGGSVILNKIDKESKANLSGAVFDLVDSENNPFMKGLKTDEKGEVVVNDLATGTYKFIETEAPAGYKVDRTPKEFEIHRDQTEPVRVTKTNQKVLGKVVLKKKDSESGKTLSGAVFDLQDSSGNLLKSELTTNESGELEIGGLEPGNYQFVEKKAPNGYELDEAPIKFTIENVSDEVVHVNAVNKLIPVNIGRVTLTKTDSDTGETLKDAVFDLQDSKGNILKEDLATDESGEITVDELPKGDYQFVEIKAPIGYELDDTPVRFTIEKSEEKVVQVYAENHLIPVNHEKGAVILTKVDEVSGKSLSGAEFELQNESGEILEKNLMTDKAGKLTVEELTPGNYQFIETKAPKGYELDKTAVHFKIKENQVEAVSVEKTNQKILGGVILSKTDEESGELLPGAVFDIQNSEGSVIASSLTTDSTGKILFDGLEPGDYKFIEVKAPVGYELNKDPINFSIPENQIEPINVTATNKLISSGVILVKKDSDSGKTLSGAVFELKDKSGKVLRQNLITDGSGKLSVDNLSPGDYQFVETTAPTGYQLDEEPINFTIKKGQSTAIQLEKENKLIPGGVILTKTDEKTGRTLSDAEFKLVKKDGTIIEESLTTDHTGCLAIEGLIPGDYQFIETAAPEGYELDKQPVPFTIDKAQTVVKRVTKTNKQKLNSVRVEKKDGDSKKLLADAEFKLLDGSGKEIRKSIHTNEQGVLVLNELASGPYQLVETKAPIGYSLDIKPTSFNVIDGKSVTLDVYNYKETISDLNDNIVAEGNTDDSFVEKSDLPTLSQSNTQANNSNAKETPKLDDTKEVKSNATYYPKMGEKSPVLLSVIGVSIIGVALGLYVLIKKIKFN